MKRSKYFDVVIASILSLGAALGAAASDRRDRSKDVKAAFEQTLDQKTAANPDVAYAAFFPRKALLLPEGELGIVLNFSDEDPGLTMIRCEVMVGTVHTKTISVTCRITRFVSLPVATRNLEVGEIVASDAYAWERSAIDRPLTQHFGSDGDLTGTQTKRRIMAGDVIRPSAVQAVAIVSRGQTVDLIMARESVRITIRATATQDGRLGERIRVKNLYSNRLAYGRVVGKGVVLYE